MKTRDWSTLRWRFAMMTVDDAYILNKRERQLGFAISWFCRTFKCYEGFAGWSAVLAVFRMEEEHVKSVPTPVSRRTPTR